MEFKELVFKEKTGQHGRIGLSIFIGDNKESIGTITWNGVSSKEKGNYVMYIEIPFMKKSFYGESEVELQGTAVRIWEKFQKIVTE